MPGGCTSSARCFSRSGWYLSMQHLGGVCVRAYRCGIVSGKSFPNAGWQRTARYVRSLRYQGGRSCNWLSRPSWSPLSMGVMVPKLWPSRL